MLYAADVWLTPQHSIPGRKKQYGSVGMIRKLARVQHQAGLMIMGAMRTTASDVLDAHANLLPFHLLADKTIFRAATHLCTLPATHPLYKHIKKAIRYVKRHHSPLHEIFEAYQLQPSSIETITAQRFHPLWQPHFGTSIASGKEAAIEEEAVWVAKPGIHIYTDGSDIDGGVGASAVLIRPGRQYGEVRILRFHLGTSEEHTVYEAELIGLILGVELLIRELSLSTASCGADNTVCIMASQTRKCNAGHYLLDMLHKQVDRLLVRHSGAWLTVRWVPGHEGIEGNECADEEAKQAAQGDSSEWEKLQRCLLKPLPISVSKVQQLGLARIQAAARAIWLASPHYAKLE